MIETYRNLKGLIGQTTEGRLSRIDEETRALGIAPKTYEIASPRGTDTHLVVEFNYDRPYDLWLTANYDTFQNLPAANNNGSGIVTLLKLSEQLQKLHPPVNIRLVYFDAGLDPDLASTGKRNPEFVPGSRLFLQHLLTTQIEFLDTYEGTITIQAVGKGDLSVFQTTGKRLENDPELNKFIVRQGASIKIPVSVKDYSPNADNMAFLEEGLSATVLARYHEGSWHKMQSREDDLTNVNSRAVAETVALLERVALTYQAPLK